MTDIDSILPKKIPIIEAEKKTFNGLRSMGISMYSYVEGNDLVLYFIKGAWTLVTLLSIAAYTSLIMKDEYLEDIICNVVLEEFLKRESEES